MPWLRKASGSPGSDIPSMEMSDVEYAEGGLLSDRRLYLRMMRERLAFDLCAAPFGNTYFFSCRTVHSPPELRLWHLVAAATFLFLVYLGLQHVLGLLFAIIAMAEAPLLAIFETFRNAGSMGLNDVDSTLIQKIPVVKASFTMKIGFARRHITGRTPGWHFW